ncbi:unnamed protein product [Schistosoma curassoni]|uniref:MMS1_N domain-containing protein n=1 Tax=Schistosoma curassoni TaxID=6186 RepID=A0A183JF74_9TREM|nr:unnamed protein product [Schistosoma curassoni]
MQLDDLDFTDNIVLLSHTHQQMWVKTTSVAAKASISIVVKDSQQETLNLGFVLIATCQQGVSIIFRELMLPDVFDPLSPRR